MKLSEIPEEVNFVYSCGMAYFRIKGHPYKWCSMQCVVLDNDVFGEDTVLSGPVYTGYFGGLNEHYGEALGKLVNAAMEEGARQVRHELMENGRMVPPGWHIEQASDWGQKRRVECIDWDNQEYVASDFSDEGNGVVGDFGSLSGVLSAWDDSK